MSAAPPAGFLPGQHALDGYGAGGFRFAGMSHRGSLLALPSGLFAWPPTRPEEIDEASLAQVLELESGTLELLILGTGDTLVPASAALRARLRAAGVRVEPMATGPAARTYNVLFAEGRRVGAALLAVE